MNCWHLLFVIFIFNTGCKNEKAEFINLSEFEEYSISKSQIQITLLKSFISNGNCDRVNSLFYANAFLCKIYETNDTIIVYNICKKPVDFLRNDYSGPKGLRIDSSTVSKNHPHLVLTIVDKVILTKKYKYLVADITNYLED